MKNHLDDEQKPNFDFIKFKEFPSFVPKNIPLKELPYPFDHYIFILDNLHDFNSEGLGGTRPFIERQLKLLNFDVSLIDDLSYWQQEKLLSVLTLLAHCYRWNYLPPHPDESTKTSMCFPEMLWKPLTHLADKLKHLYCGTQWSTTLMNFQLKNQVSGEPINLEAVNYADLEIAHSWVLPEYKEQLEQWVKIFVMTDIVGTTANAACIQILEAINNDDLEKLNNGLDKLLEGIQNITSIFNREVRGQKLNIDEWRNYIQPTFIWGLISDNSGKPLEGASGLQVGCIQLIDLILGIDMDSKMGKAMMESRKYFQKNARAVLEYLEPYRNHLKYYVNDLNDDSITAKYNKCLEAMENYRVSHRQRGKVYIKGDGSPKSITTTGLSIQSSDDAVKHFESDMNERIEEMNSLKIMQNQDNS